MNTNSSYGGLLENGTASLILSCPIEYDALLALAQFFSTKKITLSKCHQHTGFECLFLRLTWRLTGDWADEASFSNEFDNIAKSLSAEFEVRFSSRRQSIGVFVTENTELLDELLGQKRRFPSMELAFIASTNAHFSSLADRYGLPFFLIEDALTEQAEQLKILSIVQRYKLDYLAVLGCHEQLSSELLSKCVCPMFSISPIALAASNIDSLEVSGSNVYEREFDAGAKLLGAEVHFVENNEEQGIENFGQRKAIIEQQVVSIKSADSRVDMAKLGHAVERAAFSNALTLLLEHRVLKFNQRTIVFHD